MILLTQLVIEAAKIAGTAVVACTAGVVGIYAGRKIVMAATDEDPLAIAVPVAVSEPLARMAEAVKETFAEVHKAYFPGKTEDKSAA